MERYSGKTGRTERSLGLCLESSDTRTDSYLPCSKM